MCDQENGVDIIDSEALFGNIEAEIKIKLEEEKICGILPEMSNLSSFLS